jgi:hypothetical protein
MSQQTGEGNKIYTVFDIFFYLSRHLQVLQSLCPYIQSYYRSALPDEHLQSVLMMGNTNSEPQLSTILSKKIHASH